MFDRKPIAREEPLPSDKAPDGDPFGRPLHLGLISDTHGVLCPEVLHRLAGVDLILHAGDVGHRGGHSEILARMRAVAPVYAVCGNADDVDDDGDGVSVNDETNYEAGGVAVELKEDDDCGGAAADTDNVAGGGRTGSRTGGGEGGTGAPGARRLALPGHRLLEVAGWRILLTHIVGQPPHAVEPAAAELIRRLQPHLVVFGHSHKHMALAHGGRRYYNPGSAGPARFKLPRTAALLELPPRRRCSAATAAGAGAPPPQAVPEPEPAFSLIHLALRAPPRPAKRPRPRGRVTSTAVEAMSTIQAAGRGAERSACHGGGDAAAAAGSAERRGGARGRAAGPEPEEGRCGESAAQSVSVQSPAGEAGVRESIGGGGARERDGAAAGSRARRGSGARPGGGAGKRGDGGDEGRATVVGGLAGKRRREAATPARPELSSM